MELVLSEVDFEETFQPVRDSTGTWREYWPDDRATANVLDEARAQRRAWTMVDVDGFTMLASGWHFVNRLGYYISRVAIPTGAEILVYDEEDWDEWQREQQVSTTYP